jgi:1-acyl-sn-glycerol-3-phosphate acyltransferase
MSSEKIFKSKVTELRSKNPPTGNSEGIEDYERTKQTLEGLGRELDEFHSDPSAFDPKRLGAVMQELIALLKKGGSAWKGLQKLRHALQSEDVDEYGMDRKFELAIKPFFEFLYYRYFRVSVHGIENLPHEGKSILVANHSGVIPMDGAMLKVAIINEHPAKRELRFLVDDFVFHFPFLGTFMNRIGGVRACPENAERLLNNGELVSVFPEGVKGIGKLWKDRYRLERFGRGGVIRLAMKTRSPITPVAVIGGEEIYPLMYKSHILARPLGLPFIPVTPLFPLLGPLGAIPLPTKWTLFFGKPIPFDSYGPQDLNDGILVNRETENLRQVIQKMIREGLEKRRSVFEG